MTVPTTAHPETRAFLAATLGADDPAPWEEGFDLAAVRRSLAEQAPARLGRDDEVEHVEDLDADGVPCRLYRPRGSAGLVLHLHGGGWVMGCLDSHDALCRLLAARSGAAVLAVDYRLAPEHPYPAALDDVDTVVRWVQHHGDRYDVVSDRVALVGDSSGANLVAAACLRSRDRDGGRPPFAAQVLVYPPLDAESVLPSHREMPDSIGLDAEEMRWYWHTYAPSEQDRRDAYVSPLAAEDFSGLPPALVLTAELDRLRDEGELYARRLADAGVPVAAARVLGVAHGFWRRPAVFAASEASVDQAAAFCRRHLA